MAGVPEKPKTKMTTIPSGVPTKKPAKKAGDETWGQKGAASVTSYGEAVRRTGNTLKKFNEGKLFE